MDPFASGIANARPAAAKTREFKSLSWEEKPSYRHVYILFVSFRFVSFPFFSFRFFYEQPIFVIHI